MAVRNEQKLKTESKMIVKNQQGVAMLEMLPLLAVFIILFGLTFGFWTSIHTGILQSIAARHYAFEVINNRTHFVYHRDTKKPINEKQYYRKNGHRFFAVVKKQTSRLKLQPRERELSLFNADPMSVPRMRRGDQVNPIWLKIGYGICIDFECGGVP